MIFVCFRPDYDHAASEEDQAKVAPARLASKLVGTAQTKLKGKGKAPETLGPGQ